MNGDLKKLVDETYEHILQTTNKTLRNCKLFSIEVLQQEDPTYEEIAEQLEEASKLLEIVYDEYPDDAEGFRTFVKAREYTQNVINIARAIRIGNKDLLEEYVTELDRRPFT